MPHYTYPLVVGEKIETTTDNFADMVRDNCVLVDKTMMIHDFWLDQKVALLTRPRRFGKTTNLSMLQNFFASEVAGQKTKGLFDHLAIAQVDGGEFLKTHQGQYPVIFITLKDVKMTSYENAIAGMRVLIRNLYSQHQAILNNDSLTGINKSSFSAYLNNSATPEILQNALYTLSNLLFKAYNKKSIILIDEYDSPITAAYEYDYADPFSAFMRNFLSAAFKTNPYLEKGLLTGILRVSQNTMLSGLNNLEVYTLFDDTYAQYFGFTEPEVEALMTYKNVTMPLSEIKDFYNGYQIGEQILYNPWSIMNFLRKRKLEPYWVMTSNDKLLQKLFLRGNENASDKFNALIRGESIVDEIDVNLHYKDLVEKPQALWTLLLFCGYLKVEDSRFSLGSRRRCTLRIPNTEIRNLYQGIFAHALENKMGTQDYTRFLNCLTEGDVAQFTHTLGEFLMQSLSVRDVHGDNKKTERFYHGFFVGLTASLQLFYDYTSNHESGLGYYDVGLIPKDENNTVGVVLEFKLAKANEEVKQVAQTALTQIENMQYDTTFKRHAKIKQVLKIGLAFCDKAVVSAHKITTLATNENSEIEYHTLPDGE